MYNLFCVGKNVIFKSFNWFKRIKIGSNKHFGLILAFAFIIMGLYPILHNNHMKIWFVLIGTLFLVIVFTKSQFLEPLNRIWTGIGIILGKIVTPIIMGILYFSVFFLMSIIAKLLKKDFLRLKPEPNVKTYWITKKRENQEIDFINPF